MANHLQERNNNDYGCPSQVQEIYLTDDKLIEERPVREETPPCLLASLTDEMFVVEAPSFVVPYLYEKPPDKRWNQVFFPESDIIDLSSSTPPKSTNIYTDTYFTSPLGSFFIELGQDLVAESLYGNIKQKDGLNPEKENSIAKLLKCQECDFQTDSMFVLEHHLESFDSKEKLPRSPSTSRGSPVMDTHHHCLNKHSFQRPLVKRARSRLQCPVCPFDATTRYKMTAHARRCTAADRLQYNLSPQDWEPPAKVLRQSLQKVIQDAEPNPTPRSLGKKPAPEHPLDLSCPSNPASTLLRPQQFVPPTSSPRHPANLTLCPSPRIPTPFLPIGTFVPQGYPAPRGPIEPPRPFVPRNGKKKVTHGKAAFVICELCDGYVRDLGQLKLHLLVSHGVLSSPDRLPPSPPLCCPHCPLRFYTHMGRQQHLATEHKKPTSKLTQLTSFTPVAPQKSEKISYRCVVCDSGFPQYSLYIQHVEMAHPHFFRKAR